MTRSHRHENTTQHSTIHRKTKIKKYGHNARLDPMWDWVLCLFGGVPSGIDVMRIVQKVHYLFGHEVALAF
jgi:hypothetical protein